jgi:small subunit ribosomal protein S2
MDSTIEKFGLSIEEMKKAGLDKGRLISKTHPKMMDFIAGVKTPFYIIDLNKTLIFFSRALEFLEQFFREGKKLLVVETRKGFRDLAEEFAKKHNLPYVCFRWLGGILTNWQMIKKRVDLLKEMERQQQEAVWEKYTKKEQRILRKKLEKLSQKFGGLKNLENLPDAILLLNCDKDSLAIKEAQKKGIKIVAICDTNSDPTQIDFPIPASNSSRESLKYILDKIEKVMILAKENVGENQKTEGGN